MASDEQVDGERATVRVELTECVDEPAAEVVEVELVLDDDVWVVWSGTFDG